MTLTEAANALGLTPDGVRSMIRRGLIKASKSRGRTRSDGKGTRWYLNPRTVEAERKRRERAE